jgi:transposase
MTSMSSSIAQYQLFVGIDISAKTAAVAWLSPGKKVTSAFTVEQTYPGFAHLRDKLVATGHQPANVLVVMEATGCYWVGMATTLVAFGFRVSVVNPAQAHYFAKALLKRSKTDAIDAQTLAKLASLLNPELWVPPPAIYHQLQQRLTQREGLISVRTQLRNQLHALQHHPVVIEAVQTRLEILIGTLNEQVEQIESEMVEVLTTHEEWQTSAQLLQTIKGIGLITTVSLLVTTLNFTTSKTVESLTAYAGLAPTLYQSGSSVWHKPAIGHTGKARLRAALYLATLSAAQSNPMIKTFYDRLREAGKPMKVARCAAARKLLHLAWAVVKKGQPFDPNYGQVQQPG